MVERAVDGGRIGRALGGVLVAGTIAAATMVSLAPPSQVGAIGACTTTWTGVAGNGLWATAGNWDNGVPGAASVACIPEVGAPGRQRRHHAARFDHHRRDRQRRAHHPARQLDRDAQRDATVGEIVNRGVWRMRRQHHDPGLRRHRGGDLQQPRRGHTAKGGGLGDSRPPRNRAVRQLRRDRRAGRRPHGRHPTVSCPRRPIRSPPVRRLTFTSVNGMTQWQRRPRRHRRRHGRPSTVSWTPSGWSGRSDPAKPTSSAPPTWTPTTAGSPSPAP